MLRHGGVPRTTGKPGTTEFSFCAIRLDMINTFVDTNGQLLSALDCFHTHDCSPGGVELPKADVARPLNKFAARTLRGSGPARALLAVVAAFAIATGHAF